MSLVLLFISIATIFLLIQRYYRRFILGLSLAGPWAFPLLGNAQMIGKMKPEFIFLIFTELRERFGRTYRLWLGPQLWVFLHTAQETHDALHDATLVKADTFNQLNVLIGNGLLISKAKFWETHRRALTPAFHPQILRSFAPAIVKHAAVLMDKLEHTAGAAIEVSDYLFPCILDTIVDTSMGKLLHTQTADLDSIYTHAFHKTSELLFKRMINPLLASDWIFKRTALCRELNASLNVIHTLMESVIHERQQFLKEQKEEQQMDGAEQLGTKHRRTLLDTLLTAQIDGRSLSFQEVRDEVNTFVFAGVDTTTAAMAFVCYALAKYPEEQEKLQAELYAHAQADLYDMDTLNQLTYLDAFIKECLRYYTIVPTTGRQTTCDTRIGTRTYCAGITLWLNLYGLAHDAVYFPQPYEFRPERFSREHGESQPIAYSYLPFSGGPHVCIGRKYSLLIMKILTVQLVQTFHLKLRDPNEQLILQAQMVLKSMNGINIKFEVKSK